MNTEKSIVSHALDVPFEKIEKQSEHDTHDIMTSSITTAQVQAGTSMCKTTATIACSTSDSSIFPKALNSARARLIN